MGPRQSSRAQHGSEGGRQGHASARGLVKAVVPSMAQKVVDRAMQVHGGLGASQDAFLFMAFVGSRNLRWADGPDEVHWRTAGRMELAAQKKSSPLYGIGLYEHDKSVPFRAKL